MKKKLLLLFVLFSTSIFAQVKIGNNPSQINSNSLLELESTTKVFVLNRMTSVQMNAINPLQGAMIYNTDEKCIFVFEGVNWKSLCNNNTVVTTSENPPINNSIGDFWINNSNPRGILSVWDSVSWISINNNPKSGVGAPTEDAPKNPLAGDIYVNEISGELYTYNGSLWFINSSGWGGQDIRVFNNGLNKNENNDVQLGGDLIIPTTISTDATNTFALTGIQNVVNKKGVDIAVIEKSTGIVKKIPSTNLFQEEVVLILAEDGQTLFPTPLPISNSNKVNVYRNGVLVSFTAIDINTIQVETAATCYKNDEIRIVQFN